MLLVTGERKFTSINMIKDRAIEVEQDRSVIHSYNKGSIRYIIAKDLTFDFFISVYDVNSNTAFAARITRELKEADWLKVTKRIASWKNSNVEIRAFGFQNGSNELPHIVDEFHRYVKVGRIMEVDLYGTDVRHIAIDLKTGVSYNVFMLNRIYRAGELANQIKKDDFDKGRSDPVIV